MSDLTEPPMKLTTSQVSLILQRAAEIDARGDTLSVEELERIAAEAGIDARATRTAIAEFIAEEMPAAAPEPAVPAAAQLTASPPARGRRSSSPSPLRILSGGAVGVAFGFIQAFSESAAFLGFGGAVLYLVLRAVQSMKRGDQLDFQLQNFALWLGTLTGTLATDVLDGDEVTAVIFLVWLITSFLGGLLVRFGPREEEAEDDIPQLEAGGR
ncbi:MAG: hypothetical protein F4Y74_08110 [Gemmatimonadales bacterium]|nr:hypothetical protein [Gemmatimonadales bacterium]MYG19873.1 hypothetical protein [Gemmatimonadales bacterium]MYH09875.1 hypothetical protein [Gemmatimonadales bacterium]MYL06685.1 hypothetical protein [Gemmatimonadales bacterium]